MTKSVKEWKSHTEQLTLLKQRGLHITHETKALYSLKTIGYYRLSGYLYPFRDKNIDGTKLDTFLPNSHFEDVKQLYIFDKKLRNLALDALERIEIALRADIAYTLGKIDPLAHLQTTYFHSKFNHANWVEKYHQLVARESQTTFIKHHLTHYIDIPIWVACEVLDFGTMSKLYEGMDARYNDKIAKRYGLKDGSHLATHLRGLNFIRNVSPHHGRLWNRNIIGRASLKGFVGNVEPQWQLLSVNQVFVYFCLMQRMLKVICPTSTWGQRFLDLLFTEFPKVNNGAVRLEDLGLTTDLTSWQLWQ